MSTRFARRAAGRSSLQFALACLALAGLAPSRAPAAAESEAARTVIVANERDAASLSLALFYAKQRQIPADNIVMLPLPLEETITWDQFASEVFNPLAARLLERRWLGGVASEQKDRVGRTRLAIAGHRIAYLVLCRGVPLRIAHDPAREDAVVNARVNAQSRTNQASVDGELALLAGPKEITGLQRNPLFGARRPPLLDRESIVRVARLDGPTPAACEQLVRSALAGEEKGLVGRVYVDLGGPHASGDTWLTTAGTTLRALDFDVVEQREKTLFALTDRFDAPAIYLGWYAGDISGPFQLPGFRFPPGAFALHIHSFSATTLRSETKGWTGPLVALGVAATVGNVYEPFLEFSHRPDMFIAALSEGKTLGEAAYFALPALSWQAVLVGDPLYRPFLRSLDEQVAALPQRADTLAPHVALREANRLQRIDRAADVEPWLTKASRDHPGLAVSLRLAREREAAGDRDGAIRALQLFSFVRVWKPEETALLAEAAARFEQLGAGRESVAIYRTLLNNATTGEAWRRVLLPRARDAAFKLGDTTQHRLWDDALARLNAAGG